MLVAAIQTDVIFADVDANLNRMQTAIAAAAARGVELAVFPECVLTGYAFDSREAAMAVAMTIDDPRIETLREFAQSKGVAITFGFLERAAAFPSASPSGQDSSGTAEASSDRLFNTAIAIGPQESPLPHAAAESPFGIQSHYRKVHLPQLGVDRWVDRGDRPYRADRVGQANVGLAICYDCSFPEPMRVLGLAGADIVALGTNWPVAAARTADVVPPARSMENHYFFIAANRIGHENGFDFCGRSSICGPDGIVLAMAEGADETMLLAEIDLELARQKRIERTAGAHVIDRFADRRPEFYGPVSSQTAPKN